MANEKDHASSPRDAKIDRGRTQGMGVGQQEQTPEQRSFEGDLGAGTPANVDLRKLGQSDNPEEDWGEPADEGTLFSSNHTRRAEKVEAERGQGAKTRTANKDIVSRRS